MSERSLTMVQVVSRATPLPADERRAAIMAATEPLLERHGRAVSTRQIAEAAGIAEGTIFRVFATKDDLIDAVIEDVFDMHVTLAELAAVGPEGGLDARLLQAVSILQGRLKRVIALFHSLRSAPRPTTPNIEDRQRDNELINAALVKIIGPDRDRLRVPVEEAASLVRCLTFAVTHPMVTDRRMADPRRIVDDVLYGITTPTPAEETRPC